MSERLVLPVALWSSKAPAHRISCVHIMPNGRDLITGSHDGQICIWDVEQEPLLLLSPRCMIFGHSSAVLCLADGDYTDQNTLVSSSDNGEMCSWNVNDGQCLDTKKTQYTHTFMQSFRISTKECRLFCIGHYAEILVLDPKNFGICFRLTSRENPDWISTIHVLHPPTFAKICIIGLSISGILRIWTIGDETSNSLDPIYDSDMRELAGCKKSVQIISNPESLRLLLIICSSHWQIVDAIEFGELCQVKAPEFEQWTGGNFITRDQVLVWSDKGEGYLYQVTTKRGTDSKQASETKLKAKLTCKNDSRFLYPPRMILKSSSGGKLLIRGDSKGCITIWSLLQSPDSNQVMPVNFNLQRSLIPESEEWKVTTSIYISDLYKLACGRADGAISITSRTRRVPTHSLLPLNHPDDNFRPQSPDSDVAILSGHTRRINCLLYPHSTNPRYDDKHLLSGSADFSVCLWDVTSCVLIHRFNVHAGAISQFFVPPNECSKSLLNSICCVAADHSVSILNLNERKCTLLASRHVFPVKLIKWKPADDCMVVGCLDGSVYVWKIDTGHLVKVLQGIFAEDALTSCDDSYVMKEEPANTAVELFKGIKQGNISAIKNAATKGFNQLTGVLFKWNVYPSL